MSLTRVIGLPWYRREDYATLVMLFSDADKLPGTYDAWLARAQFPARMTPLIRFGPCARSISATGLDLLSITGPPPQLLVDLRAFDSIVSWYGANRPDFRDTVAALKPPGACLSTSRMTRMRPMR